MGVTMKSLLALLLAMCNVCNVSSVHSNTEALCNPPTVNCTCDLRQFNVTVLPPNPTVECVGGMMNIYISKCQLIKSKFSPSSLALIKNTGSECEGADYSVDGDVQVVFHDPMNVNKCGNSVNINDTHVTYSNILHIYPATNVIQTRNNATANMSCSFPLISKVQLNTNLKPVQSTVPLSVPGATGTLTASMVLYIDQEYSVPVTQETTLRVEDTVYLSVQIPNLEAETFAIKVMRIYATPGGTTPDNGVFNLTSGSEGCPDPVYGNLITVNQNGKNSEARFTMKVFQITNQAFVNLYADVTICQSQCIASCSGSRSSSISTEGSVATISLELSAVDTSYSGAIDRFSMRWTLFSLISALLFVKLI